MKIDFTTKIPFGKHQGLTAETILAKDPSYLVWLNEKTEHVISPRLLASAREQIGPPSTWSPNDEPETPGTKESWKHYNDWQLANETNPGDFPDYGDHQCG